MLNIKWYKNLKFRNKIIILCFVVSLIPLLTLGIFCITHSRKVLINREQEFIKSIVKQADTTLDNLLLIQENIITTLSWDEAIQAAIDKTYKSNYEMFLANFEIFDPKFLQIQAMHPEIERITLYTESNLYPHGTTIDTLKTLEEKSWYEDAINSKKPFYVFEPDTKILLLIYQVPSKNYKNIMIITLSYDYFFNQFSSLYDDEYAIGIFNEKGNLVYDYSLVNNTSDLFFEKDLNTTKEIVNKNYFSVSTCDNYYNWTLILYRPYKEITSSANSIIGIVFCLIVFCVMAIAYLGTHLSKHLVSPLEKLSKNMDAIQADNFEVTIKSKYNDEVSTLIDAFNKMTVRLKNTIDELYVNELAKERYRLSMLQSQINPHFLYNCLSMINSKAIRAGQNEISDIALWLSLFYRTSLNKGQNLISLEQELKNTKAYIEIQQMLHSTRFNVEFDIDDTLLQANVINFIIQPLIENSILHGIDYKEKTDDYVGNLKIRVYKSNDEIKIMVQDNGCGMGKDTLKALTTKETSGYGIYNVNQRIKLFFGDEYGIAYESTPMQGTTATITLPYSYEFK